MTRLSWATAWRLLLCVLVIGVTGGLVRKLEQQSEFPAPRFPSVALEAPTSVGDVMSYARQAARNRAAAFGGGLGISTAGETIAVVLSRCYNPHIVEAMRLALIEREITPVVLMRAQGMAEVWAYESALRSPSAGACVGQSSIPGQSVFEAGFTEGRNPGNGVPYPRKLRNWIRSARPDLFQRVFPDLSPELEPEPANEEPNLGFSGNSSDGVIAYLQEHPEIDGVYSAGTWYQEAGNLGPFANKWRGTTSWDRVEVPLWLHM